MDYKSSGVDIDAGNKAVDLIKNKVKSTFNSSVLNSIGGFAGMYEIPEGYKQPVLVSCTDGVGTKVKLAIEANDNSKIGIDLVAMCVNDLICCGAKPLYFLDYIACHKTVPKEMDEIISGPCFSHSFANLTKVSMLGPSRWLVFTAFPISNSPR